MLANDSARYALILGSSKAIASFALLSLFCEQEELHPSFPWFSRVASSSNSADALSRSDVESVAQALNLKYEGPVFPQDRSMAKLSQVRTVTDLIDDKLT